MSDAPNTPVTHVPYVLRVLLSRPAFWGCLLLGGVVGWLVPAQPGQPWLPKMIIGWNVGAGVFLLIAGWQIFGRPRASRRVRAMLQQDGRQLVLGLALALVLLCLGNVVAELSLARELWGPERTAHLVLAGLTWMTAWAFTQVVFTLHYAQAYFFAEVQGLPAVLTFDDGRTPNDPDFLDLAVATGLLGRYGKVTLVSPALQRLASVQRALLVLFAVVLGVLVVNVAAG